MSKLASETERASHEVVRALTAWRDGLFVAIDRRAERERQERAKLDALAALLGVA